MGSRIHLLRPYLAILGLVALSEGAVMWLLPWLLPHSSPFVQSVLDPLLLLALMGPLGWVVMRRVQPNGRATDRSDGLARRKALALTGAVLLVGLTTTGMAAFFMRRDILKEAGVDFDHHAENADDLVERAFVRPSYGLRGASGMVAAREGELDSEAFHEWIDAHDLSGEFPGVRTFGWIDRVERAEVPAYLERARRDRSEFAVQREGDGADLYLARFLEPTTTRGALGYDLGSDPIRRAAIEHAVETGELSLSGQTSLVEDELGRPGVVLVLPVYFPPRPTPEERKAALVGLVYAPIVVEDLLSGELGDDGRPVRLEIYDRSDAADGALLFGSPGDRVEDRPMFTNRRTLEVGGRRLDLVTSSTAAFEARIDRSGPRLLGAAGCLLSALLALTTWLLASGRARAEALAAEMTKSLDRLAKVAQRTTNAVLITDATGTISWVNQSLLKMSGLSEGQLVGRTTEDLGAALDLQDASLAQLHRALRRNEGFRGELLVPARDRPIWLDVEIEPLGGEVFTGSMFVAADITERKDALTRMEAAKREVESLLNTIRRHAIVSITDRDGVILEVNDAFCELTGYSRQELVGKDHRRLNSGVQPRRFWQEMWKTLAAGQSWRGEICNRAKDGSLHWVDSIIAPCVAKDGTVERFISIRIDITARKRTEERLREARNAAEKASGAKSRFLANMSHEIRTPMNAVLGMLTLLQRTTLSEAQHEYVRKTERAARSLLEILNDILDFSKVEAGKLELDPHAFDLGATMKDLWALLTANVGDKPVAVRFELDPEIPPALVGDSLRLRQVLINLGGNAIKFTSQGEVVVRARVEARTEEDVTLRFEVEDTGIGIATEHLGQIFEGFTQAEASTTRRFGGTGLGLAISRRLIALMGAELTVESQVGVGSTFAFSVRLPIAEAVAEEEAFEARGDNRLAGLRILVVEDNALNQEVAKGLLIGAGAEVELAANGKRGVEAIARATKPFDVVLMDIQMPVMDGYEATREIRWTLGMGRLPIVAMTANAMASDRGACLAAGMDEHVGKPLELGQLCRTIRALTNRTAASGTNDPPLGELALPREAIDEAAQQGLELGRALERLEGNVGLYVRLVRSFLREVPRFAEALEGAFAQGAHEDARRAMHTLKGLAATLGAEPLAKLAKEIHQGLCDDTRDTEAEAAWLERLRASVSDTTSGLTRVTQLLESGRKLLSSVTPEALGEDALKSRLIELASLLESSDLRALDVYEQLQREHAALESELGPLGEAVSAMNFADGVAQCQSLLRRFAS